MRKGQMTCLILMIAMLCVLCCQAVASSVYTALVVDHGGPIDFLKEDTLLCTGANVWEELCPVAVQLLQSTGPEEQVALVTYGESAQVVCGFTSDKTQLLLSLNTLPDGTGHRNMVAALDAANALILSRPFDEKAECRVILLTPGLTDAGDSSSDGIYGRKTVGSEWYRTDNHVPLYSYANRALSAAQQVKCQATLYTVGLFGKMEGLSVEDQDILLFFTQTVADLASSPEKSYAVEDVDELIAQIGVSRDSRVIVNENRFSDKESLNVPDVLSFSRSDVQTTPSPRPTPELIIIPTPPPTAIPTPVPTATSTPEPASFGFVPIFGIPVGDNGESWPVYAAPSENAWRGSNGKAVCWTTSDMMFAGWDGNWLLIAYRIGNQPEPSPNDGWRIGYVSNAYVRNRISRSYDVGSVFQRTPAIVAAGTVLSDDITFRSSVLTFKKDTPVTLLGRVYLNTSNGYYIETTVNGQLFRGFVKTLY